MGGGYKRIVTAGSSKGGTAAVYFGLKIGAYKVFAGACQYYIGDYLKLDRPVFKGMMGLSADESDYNVLNKKIPDLIRNSDVLPIDFFLVFSKKEVQKTYQTDMKFLIEDLKEMGYSVCEFEEQFTHHSAIGDYFVKYVIQDYNKDSQWKRK